MNGEAHFIYSTGITLMAVGTYDIFLQDKYAYPLAVFTSLSIGVVWELKVSETPNPYDLMWNMGGTLVGLGVYIGVDRLADRAQRKGLSFKINGATVARL